MAYYCESRAGLVVEAQARAIVRDPRIEGEWIVVKGSGEGKLLLCNAIIALLKYPGAMELSKKEYEALPKPHGVAIQDAPNVYVHYDVTGTLASGSRLTC